VDPTVSNFYNVNASSILAIACIDGDWTSGNKNYSMFQHEELPPRITVKLVSFFIINNFNIYIYLISKELLTRHNFAVESTSLFFIKKKKKMRYLESKIEVSNQVAVLGVYAGHMDRSRQIVNKFEPVIIIIFYFFKLF
jgi:hypothetical protein